jgi:hypothetical protein
LQEQALIDFQSIVVHGYRPVSRTETARKLP